jgi:hypothetical protein
MAQIRSFPTATTPTTAAPAPGARHRLRAVDRHEEARAPQPLHGAGVPQPLHGPGTEGIPADVTGILPPGATWLPAPPHTLPTLPGHPPMVGYLVLVPADQHPGVAGFAAQPTALGEQPDGSVIDGGGNPLVRIDRRRRTADVDGRSLELTYLEFELLAHLVAHPHRVHTRDQLVTTVWGYGHVGDGRTVDVHVARLRRKLGTEHRRVIQTVRRVGYKYAPPAGR